MPEGFRQCTLAIGCRIGDIALQTEDLGQRLFCVVIVIHNQNTVAGRGVPPGFHRRGPVLGKAFVRQYLKQLPTIYRFAQIMVASGSETPLALALHGTGGQGHDGARVAVLAQ